MIGTYAFNRSASWGTADNFHCCGCDEERSGIGGAVRPKGLPSEMSLAACRPCWERMATDKAFRQRATERAAELARPAALQHLADMLDVPMADMLAAVRSAGPRWHGIDNILKKPMGATEAALAFLLAEGTA